MHEMTNFTQPIDLSDRELDLVAGGGYSKSNECGCGGSLIRVGEVNVLNGSQTNIGVNFLGGQQSNWA